MNSTCRQLVYASLLFIGLGPAAESGAAFRVLYDPGSVRALGMGDLGIALIDHRSYTTNPASLALYAEAAERKLTIGPYASTDYPSPLFAKTVIAATASFGRDRILGPTPLALGAGYVHSRRNLGVCNVNSPEGEPVGRIEPWCSSHDLILSVAYDGPVRVAIGATLKLMRQGFELFGDSAAVVTGPDTWGLNLGLLISYPVEIVGATEEVPVNSGFSAYPTFGMTIENLGAGDDGDLSGWGHRPDRVTRLALAVTLLQENYGFDEFAIVLAAGYQKQTWPDISDIKREYGHIGAELTLVETLSLRYGWVRAEGKAEGQNSRGVGVSSRGLSRLFGGSKYERSGDAPRSLISALALEFSYAKYYDDLKYHLSGSEFYELALVLQI